MQLCVLGWASVVCLAHSMYAWLQDLPPPLTLKDVINMNKVR